MICSQGGVIGVVAGFLLGTCEMFACHALTYLRVPCAACCLELCSEVVRAGERVVVFGRAFGGPM